MKVWTTARAGAYGQEQGTAAWALPIRPKTGASQVPRGARGDVAHLISPGLLLAVTGPPEAEPGLKRDPVARGEVTPAW